MLSTSHIASYFGGRGSRERGEPVNMEATANLLLGMFISKLDFQIYNKLCYLLLIHFANIYSVISLLVYLCITLISES